MLRRVSRHLGMIVVALFVVGESPDPMARASRGSDGGPYAELDVPPPH